MALDTSLNGLRASYMISLLGRKIGLSYGNSSDQSPDSYLVGPKDIRKQVATTAAVARWAELELRIAELVPGDIVHLNAGDLAPAGGRLLDAKDLHVRKAALTGESLPVDKAAYDLRAGQYSIADASNSILLGTAVQSLSIDA